MCRNIEDYLTALRQELAAADPATRQDALSDAEEHLSVALAVSTEADATKSESDRLASIIEEYGSPSEIAGAYRIIERRMRPALAVPAQFYERSLASRFFSVIYDPRAWGALLYTIVSMLTGIVYFTWVVTGLYLSLGLIILIIGLPVAWMFFMSFRGIVLVEGRIVEGLLGVQMPRRPVFSKQGMKWLDQLKALVKDKRTWTTIAYMVLQMPLGIIYFTVSMFLFTVSLKCVASPILKYVFDRPFFIIDYEWFYVSDNLMPLVVLLGFLLFVVLMHVARGVGRMHGKLAKAMLVGK